MSHKGFINVGKEKVDVPFLIKNGQKVRIQKEIPAESNKKERKEPKEKQSHLRNKQRINRELRENKHVTESKWGPEQALQRPPQGQLCLVP